MNPISTLLSDIGTTIFTVMSALAVEHETIDLARVFPAIWSRWRQRL